MIKNIWQRVWAIPIAITAVVLYFVLIIGIGEKRASIVIDYLCEGLSESHHPND